MIEADRLGATLGFLSDLRQESVRELGRRVRALSVPPRAPLLQPGDAVSGIYFVEAGSIRVHYLDREGREGTLYQIGPGEACILAINCFFSEMAYPAWAEAGEGGAQFLVLEGEAAARLLAEDPAFVKALFAQVSCRLYELLSTLEAALRLSLEGRLIALMLNRAGRDGLLRMTQEQIARHLGTSREVVSRHLRCLAADGLVALARGRVTLTSKAGLQTRLARYS